jgi:hypothetical protein
MTDPRKSPISVSSSSSPDVEDPAFNIDTEAPIESLEGSNGKPTSTPTIKPPPSAQELAADTEAARAQIVGHEQMVGDEVDAERAVSPEEVWVDPLEAILAAADDKLPERDFAIDRLHTKLRFRAIPTARYNRIQADCTVRRRDKVTGELVTTVKDREMKILVIVESCTNLDFSDRKMWSAYGVNDLHSCVERVLLPGEIDMASIMVRDISGFNMASLEEDAGNS